MNAEKKENRRAYAKEEEQSWRRYWVMNKINKRLHERERTDNMQKEDLLISYTPSFMSSADEVQGAGRTLPLFFLLFFTHSDLFPL